ncbi:MAG: decarboxylating 6-phosphogluconate dehydrogenase [Carnobacterium sp.]|uniref:Phosphogluconate dehydrogenase (NAD(+)-dependent, decarboxylating) n=1 Tax=Carnobacterium antarcticum TaxID=2126436 RepID=A0ABW4NT67_9LACT|nr:MULTISPECIES: decarboxylating 6-phosphogluconate dehydrogenase [unclassified Carnobacterium]ALV22556.1 6-phosphogluconate dehydrogenase, decarboxylating [Carnobacterium sp. CP1]QQP70470.1 decarboxylating 6-phosphogluconate dehydrogenase [Carnobacterium sp. CS13]
MDIGLIGLGKMGYNLALNLQKNGHQVVGYDSVEEVRKQADENGIKTAGDLKELVTGFKQTKIIWIMVPAGKPLENVLSEVNELLEPNDIIIDGGNSHYKDSIRHAEVSAEKGIHFLDMGTSGGTSGANAGACLMVGGNPEAFAVIEPVLKGICVEDGYLYTGKSGSGHYLKMVHNGIEYGMMQAMAEGFEVVEKSEFEYDLADVAKVWNNGSVIRSWLMELAENAFQKDAHLDEIKGIMQSSGEGKWTVEAALEAKVPTPVIALSLMMRYRSLEEDTFTGKVVAALRNEFGGHEVTKK